MGRNRNDAERLKADGLVKPRLEETGFVCSPSPLVQRPRRILIPVRDAEFHAFKISGSGRATGQASLLLKRRIPTFPPDRARARDNFGGLC